MTSGRVACRARAQQISKQRRRARDLHKTHSYFLTTLVPTGQEFSDLKIELPQAQVRRVRQMVPRLYQCCNKGPCPEKDGPWNC